MAVQARERLEGGGRAGVRQCCGPKRSGAPQVDFVLP